MTAIDTAMAQLEVAGYTRHTFAKADGSTLITLENVDHKVQCAYACNNIENCYGYEVELYSYFDDNDHIKYADRCWLKDDSMTILSSTDTVFYYNAVFERIRPYDYEQELIARENNKGYRFMMNQVSKDHTIDELSGSSDDCIAKCNANLKCVGFVVSPAQYYCWLKDKITLESYEPNGAKLSHVYLK